MLSRPRSGEIFRAKWRGELKSEKSLQTSRNSREKSPQNFHPCARKQLKIENIADQIAKYLHNRRSYFYHAFLLKISTIPIIIQIPESRKEGGGISDDWRDLHGMFCMGRFSYPDKSLN